MKKLLVLLLIVITVISCGKKEKSVEDIISEGNLSEMRAKKSELRTQQNTISDKIEQLNEEIEKRDKSKSYPLVTVQTLNDTIFKHYVEVQGDVETDENIIIYPEFSGILSNIYVKEGERVSKGQKLAKIDDGGLSSQLAQSEAQLSLAKTTFERQERLWNKKIGSEIQFLEAKTNYNAMQKSVDQLRAQLAKTVIRAPFSGVIDEVISDQGQVVNPGQNQLFRLVNLKDMYITAEIPENYLGKVTKGSQVLVEINSIGKEFEGEVEQVSDFVNPNNRSFSVKVSVPNPEGFVKPNLIATVKLNDYTAEKTIVIPQSILQENAQGESIAYYIEPKNDTVNVARKAVLKTGLAYNSKIEVLSGLKEGQKIIVEGARTIRDGQEVKVKQ
ncbi:efflux RND transporter periplasmic adaptor subunit [Mesonia maritima]|uniref:RND family efflux transporter MFP subunit n=1 Tax=Mesonia maritima TaxID=1793873 RepID=A0ABU1K393_9FLAO|nr:efflux RND transporter periplasmic adaptor subunit [Mesonia maritima]MDR6300089.1 RND family efflux transporter MFP subunit [Mesonia maritima]